MDLVRDEPQWMFTGLPGFASQHLRVWRAPTGTLIAVVTEELDEHDHNLAGTNLIEAHELVISQLSAEYPGEAIDYIHCERRALLDFDCFNRITVRADGHSEHGLMTNDVIDHLGAEGAYRRSEDACVTTAEPRRSPGDPWRMPGC